MAGANHEARRGLLQPAKAQDAVMFISGKARGDRRANTVARHIGDDCLACKATDVYVIIDVRMSIDGETTKATDVVDLQWQQRQLYPSPP